MWWYSTVVHVCSVVSNSWRPQGLQPARLLLCPWKFPGKKTGVGCHFLLQGIFPTQGSNLHLLCLHCRWIPYLLGHQGSPLIHLHILKNSFRQCCKFLTVMYSTWSSPLLAPWTLLPDALGSMLGLQFPSSATHFLWLLLCLEPSDWRTEKGKKGMETCSHSANQCFSGQAKWFSPSHRTLAACSSPQLPHYCLWRGWTEGKKETKIRGFPLSPLSDP